MKDIRTSIAASSGDLTAGEAKEFTLAGDVHVNQLVVMAITGMTGRIFGVWNGVTASASVFDFYLDAGGQVLSDDFKIGPVSSVALFSAGNQTRATHFEIKGYDSTYSIKRDY